MCEQATGDSQTTNSLKADLEEQLPDLTRLFKNRRRDDSIVKTAQKLLVMGMTCGKVALLLRLDPEFVAELAETWNPRFRRITYTNQYVTRLTVRQYFESGSMLATICRDLQMPLFTVISHLHSEGVTDQQITSRMPDRTDPLYITYRKTVKHHANRKHKPIQLH